MSTVREKKQALKNWHEYEAMLILKHFCGLTELKKSESPDWTNEQVGVEVVTAYGAQWNKDYSNLERLVQAANISHEELLAASHKCWAPYLEWSEQVRVDTLGYIVEGMQMKWSKLNAGHYKVLSDMRLFIWSNFRFHSSANDLKEVFHNISFSQDLRKRARETLYLRFRKHTFSIVYFFSQIDRILLTLNTENFQFLEPKVIDSDKYSKELQEQLAHIKLSIEEVPS